MHAERAVLMGCSKRGVAASIATGVDPDRVAGGMATCYYGGNSLYFLARKYAEFGPDVGGPAQQRSGPGFQPADAVLRAINNPTGLRMLTHFDPYMWRNQMRSSFLVALGTNDEFFALGTPNSMMTEMSGDRGSWPWTTCPTPGSPPSTSLPGACGWRIRSWAGSCRRSRRAARHRVHNTRCRHG
ncbi:hypothetical protein [Cupriavidus necator]